MWKPFPDHNLKAWLPSISLALAAFIFVTSEFMPVGLLPDIATGLGKSEATTGLLITAYAWVVALMSLPLTVLSANIERRKLMLILFCVFIIGNAAAAFSTGFWSLLAYRLCVALAHAIFWAITTPLAARMAPEGQQGKALGLLVAGSSLATILGVPLGTALGHAMGWRMSFLLTAALAMLVWLALFRFLPLLPSSNSGSFKSLPSLMRRPALLKAYLLTMLVVTGHFTMYTYITPYFQQYFEAGVVIFILLVLGGSGIPGGMIGGKFAGTSPIQALCIALLLMGCSLVVIGFISRMLPPVLVVCCIWGITMTTIGLILQMRILDLAKDATDVAIAIYSGIFNVGIGGGALLGSIVLNNFGLNHLNYAGAIFIVTALFIALPLLKNIKK